MTLTDKITVRLKIGEPFHKSFQTGPVYRSTVCKLPRVRTYGAVYGAVCVPKGNGGGLASRGRSANFEYAKTDA